MSKKPQPRRRSRPHWTIDRKVPVAIIIALFVQTGGIIWWAATADARIAQLEKDSAAAKVLLVPQSDRLTRVEVGLENIKESLVEIKQLLRKMP